MPKMKTKKAAVKRFKKTGTGKILHAKPNTGHLMSKKTSKRKRNLRKPGSISIAMKARIAEMLP